MTVIVLIVILEKIERGSQEECLPLVNRKNHLIPTHS